MKKAFTMVELVFVIVVIGILSAVAIPRIAPIIESANNAKAKETLASVRSAVSTQRQKQILSGSFAALSITNDTGRVFSTFGSGDRVLEYDIKDCTNKGCWHHNTTGGVDNYIYYGDETCTFTLSTGRFVDNTTDGKCDELTD